MLQSGGVFGKLYVFVWWRRENEISRWIAPRKLYTSALLVCCLNLFQIAGLDSMCMYE